MSGTEMKRDQLHSTGNTHALAESEAFDKRVKITNQKLPQSVDNWGRQLPIRLLASCLSYSRAFDIACSQSVCKGWKLPIELSNRLWRPLYESDWEAETSESKAIAVAGKETAWSVRYQRRNATEKNWRSG